MCVSSRDGKTAAAAAAEVADTLEQATCDYVNYGVGIAGRKKKKNKSERARKSIKPVRVKLGTETHTHCC